MKILISITTMENIKGGAIKSFKLINSMMPENARLSDEMVDEAVKTLDATGYEYESKMFTIKRVEDDLVFKCSEEFTKDMIDVYTAYIKIATKPSINIGMKLYDLYINNKIIKKGIKLIKGVAYNTFTKDELNEIKSNVVKIQTDFIQLTMGGE